MSLWHSAYLWAAVTTGSGRQSQTLSCPRLYLRDTLGSTVAVPPQRSCDACNRWRKKEML